MSQAAAWQQFIRQRGLWSAQWNEATGSPHRAYGKAIQIPGFPAITKENVEQASMVFLQKNRHVLKLNPDELDLLWAEAVNGRWYVSYIQVKDDVQVLFSEVELRIFHNGKVMAFGSDFHQNIDISLQPEISLAAAKTSAVAGLNNDPDMDSVSGSERFYIIPVRGGQHITYHLVYEIFIETQEPVGKYVAYVDAHTGAIIWRYNRVRFADVKGTVKGDVQLRLATDPFVEQPFFDQNVTIGNTAVLTDKLGDFLSDINSTVTLTTGLRGPFVDINRQDAPDAAISMTVNPGDSVVILWDDSDSHAAERGAFYHINFAHDFITTMDPGFTRINSRLPCNVNRTGSTCNAFWNGSSITFDKAGGGCVSGAQIAIVVYHEYGHAINDRLYQQAGRQAGMVNSVAHEAMADVFSTLLENNPVFATGFFGPGTFTRRMDNLKVFPVDIDPSSPHRTGLILSGAFWDLGQAITPETAQRLGHFAKYGTPDDPDLGTLFAEWFVEVLVADDDDGDLGNGTPNSEFIDAAFSRHGIGASLFITQSFSHTPLSDTQDTLGGYDVGFNLAGLNVAPDSVRIHFTSNNFQTLETVSADLVTGSLYSGKIPAQLAGTLVQYYMSAYDPGRAERVLLPLGAPDKFFSFLVGFESRLVDAFETESGWSVGAPGDNATAGRWQRADPQATFTSGVLIQPGSDHTKDTGRLCFVTGATAGQNFFDNDVDNGKTTLRSPAYDLAGMRDPVFRYFKWYTNEKLTNPREDFWLVEISSDNGLTWTEVENTNFPTSGWEKVQFKVADFVPSAESVRMRFVASDFNQPSLVEALIDDFEILEARDIASSIEDAEDRILPQVFMLQQNYPNPFNPSTKITYELPDVTNVKLEIYNVLGERIRVLVDEAEPPGIKYVEWNGRDDHGVMVSSGIYYYKISSTAFVQTRKMLLLK